MPSSTSYSDSSLLWSTSNAEPRSSSGIQGSQNTGAVASGTSDCKSVWAAVPPSPSPAEEDEGPPAVHAAVSEPGLHKLLSGSAPSKAKIQASATTRRV
eukprot:2436529-Karenia_brevis.AAC.1